jgi:excinuclease ABC subunit B
VLVGINLLREGLDLPEVSLVAILDADKEGFLRSERSLIQTAGRAARNVSGRVVLYADVMTDSMRRALEEFARRRTKQLEYNRANGITPRTVEKSVQDVMRSTSVADSIGASEEQEVRALLGAIGEDGPEALVARLEAEMLDAARKLEFERAASLRDRIDEVRLALGAAERMGLTPAQSAHAAAGGPEGPLVRRRTPREPRAVKRRFGRDR